MPLVDHPLLKDTGFVERHPGITDVVSFLDDFASFAAGQGRAFPPYAALGVRNTKEYLDRIGDGNQQALAHYRIVKEICGFR